MQWEVFKHLLAGRLFTTQSIHNRSTQCKNYKHTCMRTTAECQCYFERSPIVLWTEIVNFQNVFYSPVCFDFEEQGHQSIFFLVKGTLWGNSKFLLEHFNDMGEWRQSLHCLLELSDLPPISDSCLSRKYCSTIFCLAELSRTPVTNFTCDMVFWLVTVFRCLAYLFCCLAAFCA